MANKVLFRNEELKEAVASFNEKAGEDTFIEVVIALSNAYQQGAVFPVAVDGDMFRTINDEEGDFLSMFTDLDEAGMGPDTELVLMTLEDLSGNILSEEGLAGFIIDPFSDPVLVDRNAVRAMVNTALSGPFKDVTVNLEGMEVSEMLDLAIEVEKGEGPFMANPLIAASIYSNLIDDDFEIMSDEDDPEEEAEFRAIQAQAMNNLAVLHLTGYGVEYDREEAEELLKEAAKAHDAGAICNLGILAEDDERFEEAAVRYEQAALLGDEKALLRYARLLFTGKGVEKDIEKAYGYFKKALEGEEADKAYYYLGLIYEEGLLGEKDSEKAGYYYEAGASSGDAKAMDGYQRIFGHPFFDEEEMDDDDDDDDEEDQLIFDFSERPRTLRS